MIMIIICVCVCIDNGSPSVAQDDFTLMAILLSLPLQCWGYRCASHHVQC